jgi:hypothetical protein
MVFPKYSLQYKPKIYTATERPKDGHKIRTALNPTCEGQMKEEFPLHKPTWHKILLEELIVIQVVKKLPTFHGT